MLRGLLTAAVVLASSVCAAFAEEPVYFADQQLKIEVGLALRKWNPTPTDMLDLTVLTAISQGVTCLTGLEYATNLTYLDLSDNQITDLSPLSGLTKLGGLDLSGNEIRDISALSGMINLTQLGLWDNQIRDISALSGLTNLTMLWLECNQIHDIAPLSGLAKLEILYLDDNEISDISPLCDLPSLTDVALFSNPLNAEAYSTYIPQLDQMGVQVWCDSPCSQRPIVSTQSAVDICATSAVLQGVVNNDGGQACQYRFSYKESGGSYSYTSWTGSVTTGQSFSELVTGLDSGSTYYFSAQARNSCGDGWWGREIAFTTTGMAQHTLVVSSTDGGSVIKPGEGSFLWTSGEEVPLEAKADPACHFTCWTGTAADAGKVADAASASTTVLVDADYTLVASFEMDTPALLRVNTLAATEVSLVSATLHGQVVRDAGEACQYRFRYRQSDGTDLHTPWTGSVTAGQSFSEDVAGLLPYKDYYFSAEIQNSADGSASGDEQSLTTLGSCDDGTPSRWMIGKVPYFWQYLVDPQNECDSSQSSQWCGQTSLRMVLSYWDCQVTLHEINERLCNANDDPSHEVSLWDLNLFDCGPNRDLPHVAQEFGFQTETGYVSAWESRLSLSVIEAWIDQRIPVIVGLLMPLGRHYVVVVGYDDDSVYYNDPASGCDLSMGRQEFKNKWDSCNALDFFTPRYNGYCVVYEPGAIHSETHSHPVDDKRDCFGGPDVPLFPDVEYFTETPQTEQ